MEWSAGIPNYPGGWKCYNHHRCQGHAHRTGSRRWTCDSCDKDPTICSPGKSINKTMLINWHEKLKRSLRIRGFHESVADPCVFIKNGTTKDEDVNIAPPANSGSETMQTRNEDVNIAPPGNSGSETMQNFPSDQSPQLGSSGDDDKSIIEQFRKSSGSIIVLTYVDDCIILARDRKTITKFIATLKYGPEKFDFTDEGTLSKYLGVDIQRLSSDNGFTMSQPFLIERILHAADIDLRMTNGRKTPAVEPVLGRDESGAERKHN